MRSWFFGVSPSEVHASGIGISVTKLKIKMKENNKPFFGKEESQMLGGIAILLMIWHHLFCFPSWYSEGVGWTPVLGYFGAGLTRIPAVFGNICVQMFALISGYALFINTKSYGSWKSRGAKLMRFLGAYWLIYFIFLIIALLNDDGLPSFREFVFNLFGRHTGPKREWVNVPFAWYVTFYIEFVLLTPLLLYLFRGKEFWKDAAALCVLIVGIYLTRLYLSEGIVGEVLEITPLVCVGFGIVAAKHNLFLRFHNRIGKRIPSVVYLLCVACLMVFKYILPKFNPNGGVIGASSVRF